MRDADEGNNWHRIALAACCLLLQGMEVSRICVFVQFLAVSTIIGAKIYFS